MLYNARKILQAVAERAALLTGSFSAPSRSIWIGRRRLIFVCTGNICRSPYAEAVARAHGLEAVSCGIDTENGVPADATALQQARLRGVDLSGHSATRWEDMQLRPGDIIIAMQVSHARAVVQRAREAGCPVILFSALTGPGTQIVWDPFGLPTQEFERAFSLIDRGLHRIVRLMRSVQDSATEHYAKPQGRKGLVPFAWKLLKDLLGRFLVTIGTHRRMLRGRAIAVAFHSVVDSESSGALRCSLEDFERYCAFFAKHFKVVPYSELVGKLQRKEALSGELSVTFDDGYADNAELALPVLNGMSLPATFFLTTGFMESATQTPWDTKVNIRSSWLSWHQVKQLIESGHEIGAHTVSHANLGVLSDERAIEELRTSRDTLIQRTGITPRHFALPFGRSYPTIGHTIELAKQVGFESFSLCRGGVLRQGGDPMLIERWPINPMEYLSPYGWMADLLRDSDVPPAHAEGH